MKRKILFLFLFFNAMLCTYPAGVGLRHVAGVKSVGVTAGTGWGNTFDIGFTQNYQVHRRWSVSVELDYERGRFKPDAEYQAFTLKPGVEAMVWQPCSWLYLHLYGHLVWGWDWWNDLRVYGSKDDGTAVGCDLGFNLEFYPINELSILLSARQNFKCAWLHQEKDLYFSPLFQLGLRYHIH